MRTQSIAKAEAIRRIQRERSKHVIVCPSCNFKSVFLRKPSHACCAQCNADLTTTISASDPFALAGSLRDLGYIVPRITTADGRTERDARARLDAGAELNKLAAYFRHEAMSDGFVGDVEGESPADTAIRVMRRERGAA